MKPLILLFTIFLVGGTQVAQITPEQTPPEYKPTILLPVIQRQITDSLERDFLDVAAESDRKTLLLIAEKKKVDRENVLLRKENARLRKALNRIDTVYITKKPFFKRLFNKKKKNIRKL